MVDGVGDGCEKAESLADHRDAGHLKELTSGSEPGRVQGIVHTLLATVEGRLEKGDGIECSPL